MDGYLNWNIFVSAEGRLARTPFLIACAMLFAVLVLYEAVLGGQTLTLLTGWFAYDRDVLSGLGLKGDEQLVGFVHIGKSEKANEDRPRPVLADIVTRF